VSADYILRDIIVQQRSTAATNDGTVGGESNANGNHDEPSACG
jgi:hypothetical protein